MPIKRPKRINVVIGEDAVEMIDHFKKSKGYSTRDEALHEFIMEKSVII